MGHKRIGLPLNEWPQCDRDAWQRAMQDGDPLKPAGRAAAWRPATAAKVLHDYSRWLAFLLMRGWLDKVDCPSQRLTRDRLLAYRAELIASGISSTTLRTMLTNLREALQVMSPEANLHDLHVLTLDARRRAVPSRNKAARLVSPAKLYAKARQHFRRVVQKPMTGRTAGNLRDALIVMFLAYRPVRLSNLTMMRIDRHLIGAGDTYRVRFSADETKDKLPLEFLLPTELAAFLRHYIEVGRLALLKGQRSDALWLSIRNTPMVSNTIYVQVVKLTKKLVGRSINPHLFRDCVATFIAEVAPVDAAIISRILGHTTMAISEKYYNHAGVVSAQRMLDRAIERQRAKGAD